MVKFVDHNVVKDVFAKTSEVGLPTERLNRRE